jgi:hypothetical protein
MVFPNDFPDEIKGGVEEKIKNMNITKNVMVRVFVFECVYYLSAPIELV